MDEFFSKLPHTSVIGSGGKTFSPGRHNRHVFPFRMDQPVKSWHTSKPYILCRIIVIIIEYGIILLLRIYHKPKQIPVIFIQPLRLIIFRHSMLQKYQFLIVHQIPVKILETSKWIHYSLICLRRKRKIIQKKQDFVIPGKRLHNFSKFHQFPALRCIFTDNKIWFHPGNRIFTDIAEHNLSVIISPVDSVREQPDLFFLPCTFPCTEPAYKKGFFSGKSL